MEAMGKTVDAFGNITSTLEGNATCTPDRQKDLLRPLMFCVAKHICTFELKSMTNSSGLPVTLQGEMVDSIWINSELQIERMHTRMLSALSAPEAHALSPVGPGGSTSSTPLKPPSASLSPLNPATDFNPKHFHTLMEEVNLTAAA